MDNFDLYKDIAQRTGGDIYVGVVGPVRTGKSTFIKKFMEGLVVDNIADPNKRKRTIDELPQSADGRTIMTTQPKFVPNEGVKVAFSDVLSVNMRMIDCVGYLVEGAVGHTEDGHERMVRTPWSDTEMPFEKAAELGTEKVIKEHSTIGVLVTTDGTISDIEREKYVPAEERVVEEMKAQGKPFVLVLNSAKPKSEEAIKLAQSLQQKYGVQTLLKDALNLNNEDITEIMEAILMEFPVKLIDLNCPKWLQALPEDSEVVSDILERLRRGAESVNKMGDHKTVEAVFADSEFVTAERVELDAGKGRIEATCKPADGLFYKVASKQCGTELEDEFSLLVYVTTLAKERKRTEKLGKAMDEVMSCGYGIVSPCSEDLVLEEPVMVKQGGQYGVKLKASAPSLHVIRVDVETEVSPIVGSEQQGEELVKNMLADFEGDKKGIWETNIFGRSLSSLVGDGLNNKLGCMPSDAKQKIGRTLGRIVNEGRGGVLCILL